MLGKDDFTTIRLIAQVYPNPSVSASTLHIGNLDLSGLRFELFDLNGRIIDTGVVRHSQTRIEVGQYPSAHYLLNVYNGNQKIKTFKIIKNDK